MYLCEPEVDSVGSFLNHFLLFFETWPLMDLMPSNSAKHAGWLVNYKSPLVFTSPVFKYRHTLPYPAFLQECLGTKLRFSCLCGKPFTVWAISPAPRFQFYHEGKGSHWMSVKTFSKCWFKLHLWSDWPVISDLREHEWDSDFVLRNSYSRSSKKDVVVIHEVLKKK